MLAPRVLATAVAVESAAGLAGPWPVAATCGCGCGCECGRGRGGGSAGGIEEERVDGDEATCERRAVGFEGVADDDDEEGAVRSLTAWA